MKRIFNKLLLISATSCLISNSVFAQETVCYKDGIERPSLIENIALDGGECKGIYSIKQMEEKGWGVLDIKINSTQNKFNYSYLLTKNGNAPLYSETTEEVKLDNNLNTNTNTNVTKKKFSIKLIGAKVEDIQNNKSKINVGNLLIGQSGVVVHIYDKDKRIIISNAKVIESNTNDSTVEFFNFDDLTQDALPTIKKEVKKDDVIVLNYMYNSSLLIAPSQETLQLVRNNFKLNNFTHPDIFATKLKIDNIKYPSKEDIQKFAIEQNLGTIFFVLDGAIYIVDTKTFNILESYNVSYAKNDVIMPFYTRVENIESSLLDFSFFSDKKDLNYDEYYKRILGL
uniref:plasminogen-binding N-terminal domain-containing protein n=1 Tax=Aliarcobacter sp. TaxID=2321116 RepID=UPI0040480D1A